MTDEEHERVMEVKEHIDRAVVDLADRMITNARVTPDQEQLIRTLLSEQVRFWKRV